MDYRNQSKPERKKKGKGKYEMKKEQMRVIENQLRRLAENFIAMRTSKFTDYDKIGCQSDEKVKKFDLDENKAQLENFFRGKANYVVPKMMSIL